MLRKSKDGSRKKKVFRRLTTPTAALLFLAAAPFVVSLVFPGCSSVDYSLPATSCDGACAATQRLNCPDDDPASCVAACERDELPWFSPRVGPCDPEEIELVECQKAAPATAFACTDGIGTTAVEFVCAREQDALQRCRNPITGGGIAVCNAWLAACATSDAGSPRAFDGGPPVGPGSICPFPYPEYICPEQQAQLYDCLLQHPAQCAAGPVGALACAGQLERFEACDPAFLRAACDGRAWACPSKLGWTGDTVVTHDRYLEECAALRPPLVRDRPCITERAAYVGCLSEQGDECDLQRLTESCAPARAALDTCAAGPTDAGATE